MGKTAPDSFIRAEQTQTSPYIIHGTHCMKDRDTRPKAWQRVWPAHAPDCFIRSSPIFPVKGQRPTPTVSVQTAWCIYLKDGAAGPKVCHRTCALQSYSSTRASSCTNSVLIARSVPSPLTSRVAGLERVRKEHLVLKRSNSYVAGAGGARSTYLTPYTK